MYICCWLSHWLWAICVASPLCHILALGLKKLSHSNAFSKSDFPSRLGYFWLNSSILCFLNADIMFPVIVPSLLLLSTKISVLLSLISFNLDCNTLSWSWAWIVISSAHLLASFTVLSANWPITSELLDIDARNLSNRDISLSKSFIKSDIGMSSESLYSISLLLPLPFQLNMTALVIYLLP